MDIGLLVLRIVVGLYLFGHGSQKLFGWFGGHGLAGTSGTMTRLRFRPAGFWALVSGLAEAGGGLLFLLGLLSPLGSAGIAAAMLTAIFSVHWSRGVWNSNQGFELPLTNLAGAVAVGFAGPGRYSLDSVLRIAFPEPLTGIVLVALVLLGVIVAFASRIREEVTERRTETA